MLNRRRIIKTLAALSIAISFSGREATARNMAKKSRIASQQYPWGTFFRREGRNWEDDLPASIGQVAAAGFAGFEPTFNTVQDIDRLGPLLEKQGLFAHSLYVNSVLHERDQADNSMAQVLQIATAAKKLGVQIIVTNPSPIRWGGDEDKTDEQLQQQARALNELGAALRRAGLTLAYHNHDAEMRNSAREFHHMMQGTDPKNVRLCLDAHWIYRGAGNSQVALFDIVDLYMDRIVELHLRQSQNGVWTEAFGPGDIDYQRLASVLLDHKKRPHLVLEQAVEAGSPNTMDAVEAHRRGLEYTRKIFANFIN